MEKEKEVKETKKEEKKETKEVQTNEPAITADDIKEGGKDCLDIIKGIFTKPFDVIKKFATEKKFLAGAMLMIIAALAKGLYKVTTLKNMFDSSSSSNFSSADIASVLNGNYGLKEPNYAEEFFKSFGYGLLEYVAIAIIGYFVVTKLLKATKVTCKQLVAATGVALSVTALAFLVNAGLVYIDEEIVSYIRGYITSFGYIFSILIFYTVISELAGIDKNKLFIAVSSAFIGATAVVDIVQKILD